MIFVSYASEDEPIASKLYQLLKAKNLDVWMDKKELKPGQEWETQIWRAATSADFFCLLLSPRSVNKRGFIRKEVRFALDKWKEKLSEDVYLIPCRIERVEPPFELKHLQYIDLNTDSDYATGHTFSLKQAFANPDEALQIISHACRHDLLKQWSLQGILPDESSERWVGEGAGPNWDNFKSCIFHDGLLRIYFNPYSVGPYVWGARIVSIDLSDLQDLLATDFVIG